jgi:hypothetical protein
LCEDDVFGVVGLGPTEPGRKGASVDHQVSGRVGVDGRVPQPGDRTLKDLGFNLRPKFELAQC